MTDNEMLKLILEKVTNLDMKVSGLESGMQEVRQDVSKLKSDMKTANLKLEKLESQMSALRASQIDLRKEVKEVNIKISETYDLALDAWGTSTENRNWLQTLDQS